MRSLLAMLLLLVAGFVARPAGAAVPGTLRIGDPLCYAVTARDAPAASDYRCAGDPAGYQQGTLWLRATLDGAGNDGLILLVHQTRLEGLSVLFGYADGMVVAAGTVRRGAYGDHWRIGGQSSFAAPARKAPVSWVRIRVDGLSDVDLLRLRLFATPEAERGLSLMAVLVGGALTLLLLGAIYSLSLAVATRRPFMAWHAAWAVCLLVWGLIWSQLALAFVPGIAGTVAAQLNTLISTLAIACATTCAMTSIPRPLLPRHAHAGVTALGWLIAAVGAVAAAVTGSSLAVFAILLAVLILADIAAVMACILVAWRRGSLDARDFALAWVLPMIVLGLTQVLDFGTSLFGGGAQLAVLLTSALQTLWLAVSVTLRLSRMRLERDAAQHAQRELDELARRDSLTGLLNRRGFVDRATAILDTPAPEMVPFGLLLIDIDHFKAINDRFGHDVGDAVLQRIADRLRTWEGELCFAGRLGGEEFVLGLPGIGGAVLMQFAESVREGIASSRQTSALTQGQPVTASIGAAVAMTGVDFKTLYKAADMALYEAKRQGRNRVVKGGMLDGSVSQAGRSIIG